MLEALWLHTGPNQPRLGLVMNNFRGLEDSSANEVFNDLFWKFDTKREIDLSAFGDWGINSRILKIELMDLDVSQFQIGSGRAREPQALERVAPISSVVSDTRIVFNYTDESGEAFTSEGVVVETQMPPMGMPIALRGLELQVRQAQIERRSSAIFLASRQSNSQSDAERFSKLQLNRKHHKVESIMRRVEPRLQGLSVIANPSLPTIHAELEGHDRLLPMPLLGDGMTRLLSLALAIGNSENGLVLIDEIENGLHHSVMKSVWSGIAQFAREFDVQIFATTHSRECIRAAHQAFSEDDLYDFRLHRMERIKDSDDTRVVTYSKKTLEIALKRDLEVR